MSPGNPPATVDVRVDDLSSPPVRALVEAHVAGMLGSSPPGTSYALAVDGLRQPGVTFWSAWQGTALCGCGALKALGDAGGEVKSMRTLGSFLRQGVAQAVLDRIVATARDRGYRRLHLETGTGPAFEAAHRFYLHNGFAWSGPFGDYVATDFNVFMVKAVGPGARAA